MLSLQENSFMFLKTINLVKISIKINIQVHKGLQWGHVRKLI